MTLILKMVADDDGHPKASPTRDRSLRRGASSITLTPALDFVDIPLGDNLQAAGAITQTAGRLHKDGRGVSTLTRAVPPH
jgi:hypothetical protein